MRIFNGKKAGESILLDLKKKIEREKAKLKLAVILVGNDKASKLFIRNKTLAARKIGIKILFHKFKENVKEKEIIQELKDLDKEQSVNGIIVQLPLPKGFNTEKIIKEINPTKDVDGFVEKSYFYPPLISAILIALKKSAKDIKSKKIIALVNSDIFGKTIKDFLKREKIRINCILRKKLSKAKIRAMLKSADVIITACGCPDLIKGDMVKKGVSLIDIGTSFSSKGKLVGDVNKESVRDKVSFLTPVPGGIGPLTVALLLKNVYLSKK